MGSRKGANYHIRCTGEALRTAERHAQPVKADEYGEAMTLFATNFCPFVQRVWIALEYLNSGESNVPYTYFEVDPYAKPKALMDVNPKGLVPALRLDGQEGDDGQKQENDRKCLAESTVILEYLQDRYGNATSFKRSIMATTNAFDRARQRLACDQINRTLLPAFYRYLQAQEAEKQVENGQEYVEELKKFSNGMLKEEQGVLWNGTNDLSMPDMMIAPWIIRSLNVLKFYRGLELEKLFDSQSRFSRYCKALVEHPSVKATTSTDDLYLDSYARYAENRPNTSQVANAINSGRE